MARLNQPLRHTDEAAEGRSGVLPVNRDPARNVSHETSDQGCWLVNLANDLTIPTLADHIAKLPPEVPQGDPSAGDLLAQNRALRQQLETVINLLRDAVARHHDDVKKLEAELEEVRAGSKRVSREPATISWDGWGGDSRSAESELRAELTAARGREDQLSSELANFRRQAAVVIAGARAEINQLRQNLTDLQDAERTNVLVQDALRQDLSGLRRALSERQQELRNAYEVQHALSDELEDTRRDLDLMRAELKRLQREQTASGGASSAMRQATSDSRAPNLGSTLGRLIRRTSGS